MINGKPTYLIEIATQSDTKEVTLPRGLVRQLLDMAEMDPAQFNEGHEGVIEHFREAIGDNERREHMTFLVPFLHYDGERRGELDDDARFKVLRECDGYGDTKQPELLYDWSHVRDSSVEALRRAHHTIESILAAA